MEGLSPRLSGKFENCYIYVSKYTLIVFFYFDYDFLNLGGGKKRFSPCFFLGISSFRSNLN